MKCNTQGQLFIGLIVLVVGVVALVDNLNIFNMRNVLHFWPTIFIVFGVLQLRQAGNGKHRLLAAFFIALGGLMTLDNMEVIHFSMRDWWPAILVVIGIKIVFFDRKADGKFGSFVEQVNETERNLNITTILSGSQGNVTSQDFKYGDITALLGGVELDFRQANIVDQAVLNVTAVMGGVVLKLPRDWIVENQMASFMGGSHDKTMPSVDARKRLVVTGTAIMGGIEIKN